MTTLEAVTLITGYARPATTGMDATGRIRFYEALGLVLELLMATLSEPELAEVTAIRDASDVLAGLATAEETVEEYMPYPAPA